MKRNLYPAVIADYRLVVTGILFLSLIPLLTLLGCSGCGEEVPKVDPNVHTHPGGTPHSHGPEDTVQSPESETTEGTENVMEAEGENSDPPAGPIDKDILAAFVPAMKLKDTSPELASEKMHAIARELGEGDPEMTEYYHLIGHSLIPQPPEGVKLQPNRAVLPPIEAQRLLELKEKLFGLNEEEQTKLERSRLANRWNQERYEVIRQTEPIRFLRKWMKENVPDESAIIEEYFYEKIKMGAYPRDAPLSEQNFRDTNARVDFQYNTFFEALELLPDDSATLNTLLDESDYSTIQEKLRHEMATIQAEPPPPNPIPSPHTIDMEHDAADISEHAGMPPHPNEITEGEVAEPRKSFQERANRAQQLLKQYGYEEGLRKIKAEDPDMATRLEKSTPIRTRTEVSTQK